MVTNELTKLEENRQSFISFNSKKIERFVSLLPNANVIKILQAVFFFLHTNQARLPGYIAGNAPCGVFNFTLDPSVHQFLKNKFPTISFAINPEPENCFVQTIALIGSAGTIAYNRNSDFDFWLCVDKNSVSETEYANFRKKVVEIQSWATIQLKLEIHLFVNDITALQRNIFDEDEDEAFGSTLGALLKDEFYRSSIVMAGKTPFWWVVDSTCDDAKYKRLLKESIEAGTKDYIDIGNLYSISKEDFVGAALFQIVKSLGNPFKSILKLGVLEKYLFDSGSVTLISHKLKNAIHTGDLTNTVLDSYLMMFSEVYDYYSRQNLPQVLLDILKINLYLKINPQLSKYTNFKSAASLPYKVEEMLQNCKKWRWNREHVSKLDNFENWDFQQMSKFWEQVQKFMLLSYQKISSQFSSFSLEDKISPSDFSLLRGKIRSYFTRSENKIENHISFTETPSVTYLFLYENKGGSPWSLCKKNSEGAEVSLKVSTSLFPLLAWAVINSIFEPSFSYITCEPHLKALEPMLSELMISMSQNFKAVLTKTKNTSFLKNPYRSHSFICLDFPPVKNYKPLSLIDVLYHTSWGENYHERLDSPSNAVDALFAILQGCTNNKLSFDKSITFYSPIKNLPEHKALITLYKTAYNHIQENAVSRFVSFVKDKFVLVTRIKDKVDFTSYDTIMQLFNAVSFVPVSGIRYKMHGNGHPVLSIIESFEERRVRDSVTLFVQTIKGVSIITVINECGSYFFSMHAEKHLDDALNSIISFLHSTFLNLEKLNQFSFLKDSSIRVFTVTQPRTGIHYADISEKTMARFYAQPPVKGIKVNYSRDNLYEVFGLPDGYRPLTDTVSLLLANRQKIPFFHSVTSLQLTGFADTAYLNTNIYLRERYKMESLAANALRSQAKSQ